MFDFSRMCVVSCASTVVMGSITYSSTTLMAVTPASASALLNSATAPPGAGLR